MKAMLHVVAAFALLLANGAQGQTVSFNNLEDGDSVSDQGFVTSVQFEGIPQGEVGRLDVWLVQMPDEVYLAGLVLSCEEYDGSVKDYYSGFRMKLLTPDFYAQGCSVLNSEFDLVVKLGAFEDLVVSGDNLSLNAAVRSVSFSGWSYGKEIHLIAK